jgi:hypothetical protein
MLNPIEPPWYVTRMPGGVTGTARESLPMSINDASLRDYRSRLVAFRTDVFSTKTGLSIGAVTGLSSLRDELTEIPAHRVGNDRQRLEKH